MSSTFADLSDKGIRVTSKLMCHQCQEWISLAPGLLKHHERKVLCIL